MSWPPGGAAMHVFTRSGHAVVCEETAHVGTHELISSALLCGITFRTVNGGPRGMVTAAFGVPSPASARA